MRFYILQECFDGRESCLAPMAYTESGFDSYGKARAFLDRHGRRFSPRIVRKDRLERVKDSFRAANN